MTKLNELHQSLILHHIKQRYFKDDIYVRLPPLFPLLLSSQFLSFRLDFPLSN